MAEVVDFHFQFGQRVLLNYSDQEGNDKNVFVQIEDITYIDNNKWYLVKIPKNIKTEFESYLPGVFKHQYQEDRRFFYSLVDPDELEPAKRILNVIK